MSAKRRDDRDRIGMRQPAHVAAADEHDEDGRGHRDVDRARRRAEPGVQECEAFRQGPFDRQALQELLGIAQCEVRRGDEQQGRRSDERDGDEVSGPRGSREVLCQPGEGRARPERDIASRHEQDEQERPGDGGEAREQRDEEARPLQGLQAGRPQLVRRSRDGVATTDGRERQREAEEIHERRVEYPPASDRHRRGRRGERAPWHRSSEYADQAPGRQEREDADRDPDAARDAVRGEVQPDPGAEPQEPGEQHGHHGGEIFGAQEARQAPARDRRQRDCRCVLADDDTGEGGEEEPFGEAGRGCGSRRPRAKGLMDAGDRASREQQRPALDVDGANKRAHDRGREHEPGGGVPERRSQRTHHEERADAQLRDRQRGRFPHRHERQQRCRGQNDPDLTTGSILEWDGHRVEEPRRMIARTAIRYCASA